MWYYMMACQGRITAYVVYFMLPLGLARNSSRRQKRVTMKTEDYRSTLPLFDGNQVDDNDQQAANAVLGHCQ
ncbi:hypothetical protein HDV63DRAFT_377186 [Trichoderma sp. SZMC 28014]